MKRWIALLIFIAVLFVGVGYALRGSPKPPRTAHELVAHFFEFQLKDEIRAEVQESGAPFAIHGVSYWERGTLSLSKVDYQTLVEQVENEAKYRRETYPEGIHYSYLPTWNKERLVFTLDSVKREVSYYYTEH